MASDALVRIRERERDIATRERAELHRSLLDVLRSIGVEISDYEAEQPASHDRDRPSLPATQCVERMKLRFRS